jgi:hypothetical protein
MKFATTQLNFQIPDSKIFIGAAGMDVALNMPKTKMNLGSMPAMSATLNTEASDVMHAIILPVIHFHLSCTQGIQWWGCLLFFIFFMAPLRGASSSDTLKSIFTINRPYQYNTWFYTNGYNTLHIFRSSLSTSPWLRVCAQALISLIISLGSRLHSSVLPVSLPGAQIPTVSQTNQGVEKIAINHL